MSTEPGADGRPNGSGYVSASRRARPVAVIVLLVGLGATIGGAYLSREGVAERKASALAREADQLTDDINLVIQQVEAVVDNVDGAVVASNADQADLALVIDPAVDKDPLLSSVSVLTADNNSVDFYAQSGTTRILDPETPDLEALEALASIPSDRLSIVARRTIGETELIGLGRSVQGASQQWVVFVELAIPRYLFDSGADDGTPTTNFAYYLAAEPANEDLILASTTDLPLEGTQATREIVLGEESTLLVVEAAGPLVSRAAELTPWFILIGGLVATVLVAAAVQALLSRRLQVVALSEEKAELDAALATSRRIEGELRASEQRFRSVITSSPDIILWMDPEGTSLQVLNREDYLGHPRSAVEDPQHFLALVHEDDWPDAEEGFDAIRESAPGEVTEFEFRSKDTEGTWRSLRVRGGVVEDAGAGSSHILALLTDVTAQKQEELRNAALEAQLAQSQRLEAVGQLAGGVAHDFNNILAAILSGAELALDDVPEGPAREDLEEIRTTARRGADLARQLLLFSRRDGTSTAEVLDLNEVMTNMRRMLDRTLDEGIELRTELSDDLDPVRADPSDVERVVMNLTLNARDAMPSGGMITLATTHVRLDDDHTSVRAGLQAGSYVQLEVTDTGSGMSPKTIAHAFEPFFSTKEVGKGTGLGLSTVYGIVQRWKGHVEIDSEAGRGTCVRILIPAMASATLAAKVAKKPAAVLEGNGERVLVVEDEPAVRNATRRLLERRGYVVSVAEDGLAASAVAANEWFDLLLTDVLMPGGMSGKDVADVLKKRQPHLAILYMTGHSADVLESVGLQANAIPIVQKPFTEEVLLRMVRTTLDNAMEPAT